MQEERAETGEPPEIDDGSTTLPLAFNMNYYRPHIFGLEAEVELRALVEHFGLTVDDPQSEGMGRGPYSTSGFLKSWNAGNAFGYKALGERGFGDVPLTLPTADIERYWRWNYSVTDYQKKLGDVVFVAKAMFLKIDGTVMGCAVWPDGIPIALPDVDLVLLMRDELSPRGLFRRKAKPDQTLMRSADLAPALRRATRQTAPGPHALLPYQDRPSEVLNFFKGLKPTAEPLTGVSIDTLLNRELLSRIS